MTQFADPLSEIYCLEELQQRNISRDLELGPSAVIFDLCCTFTVFPFLFLPASCSGCGPGYRSPLEAMKGEICSGFLQAHILT